MLAFYALQHGHLLDGYLVEFMKAFLLRHAFVDKHRIQVLHVTEANQLINRRIIADIALKKILLIV